MGGEGDGAFTRDSGGGWFFVRDSFLEDGVFGEGGREGGFLLVFIAGAEGGALGLGLLTEARGSEAAYRCVGFGV